MHGEKGEKRGSEGGAAFVEDVDKVEKQGLSGDNRKQTNDLDNGRVISLGQKFVTNIAVKMHDDFQKWNQVQREDIKSSLSVDDVLLLNNIVHFDNGFMRIARLES